MEADTGAEEPEKQIKTNSGKGQVRREQGPYGHSLADVGCAEVGAGGTELRWVEVAATSCGWWR